MSAYENLYFSKLFYSVASRVEERSHKNLIVTLFGKSDKIETKTVKIRGISKQLDETDLKIYFEDKTMSGGGQIETISYDAQDDGVALLKFKRTEGLDLNNILRIIWRSAYFTIFMLWRFVLAHTHKPLSIKYCDCINALLNEILHDITAI
jgi:hypothetical protein